MDMAESDDRPERAWSAWSGGTRDEGRRGDGAKQYAVRRANRAWRSRDLGHRDVPPEVTTGRVVVVVGGGLVVVVVGGVVLGVVCGVPVDGANPTVGGEVVDGVVDGVVSVVGDDVGVEGTVVVVEGNKVEVLFAGCSLATTTPMSTVAPVAAMRDARVRRLTRKWARRLAAGEW